MRALLVTLVGLLFIGCSSCKSASAAGRDYQKPKAASPKAMVPAPLISRGKPVESNLRMSSADKLTDGRYKDGSWAAKLPTADKPAWVALELGPGPERLLLAWTASGSFNHKETQYGGPGSYRIETSADSTNGSNGTWKAVVTVPDNEYRTRAHGFDFKGQRWVRWVVTGPSKDTYQYGIQPDELDVHDITAASDDTWFFLGDSITAMAFNRNPKGQPSFAEVVAKKHPGYFPMQLNGGIGFEKTGEGLKRLPQLLKEHPDVKHWAIGYGTNDSAGNQTDPTEFQNNLEQMIQLIKAAGKDPILARIPFAPEEHEGIPKFNEVVDALTKKHNLTPGPDLYAWFKAHPDELEDKLHPNDKGVVSINRLWAQAVDGLY